jgi:hypothetical protein
VQNKYESGWKNMWENCIEREFDMYQKLKDLKAVESHSRSFIDYFGKEKEYIAC